MKKTILLTGGTDGIGLETAKKLISLGHRVLLHGRNAAKLDEVVRSLRSLSGDVPIEAYLANLACLADVEALAKAVSDKFNSLDVLINNAGVFVVPQPVTSNGIDLRFAVNTIAPYLLTKRLLSRLGKSGRVINLSSAAQAPVDMKAFAGKQRLGDGEAYAQSKLALMMWSRNLAMSLADDGPAIIAVNPGSMLGSKMVKDAYGVKGGDIRIGAEILARAALADEFAAASGHYFDNDSRQFTSPHPDALNSQRCEEVVRAIEGYIKTRTHTKESHL